MKKENQEQINRIAACLGIIKANEEAMGKERVDNLTGQALVYIAFFSDDESGVVPPGEARDQMLASIVSFCDLIETIK